MPDLYLIMNHRLTAPQEEDARRSLGVQRIVCLPEELKQVWAQIPADVEEIAPLLRPIQQWLKDSSGESDYVLIQGDFGACHLMVRFALDMGLLPVYSTTAREAVETHRADGSVELSHRFLHRRFRRYGV